MGYYFKYTFKKNNLEIHFTAGVISNLVNFLPKI